MSSWVNVIEGEALAGGTRLEVGRGINGTQGRKRPHGCSRDGSPDTTELMVRPLVLINVARAHLKFLNPTSPVQVAVLLAASY